MRGVDELDLNLARKKVEDLANFSAPLTKDGEIKFSYLFFFFFPVFSKKGRYLTVFPIKARNGAST